MQTQGKSKIHLGVMFLVNTSCYKMTRSTWVQTFNLYPSSIQMKENYVRSLNWNTDKTGIPQQLQ